MTALLWGAVAASSLVIGALLAFARRWPDRQLGLVLAFGAGALISAVSFELAAAGVEEGGVVAVALGLAAGALTYFLLNRRLERRGAGTGLALGAFLDGIPEQLVLGIGVAAGDGVSLSLLVAIFVSNLPESIGSASEMAGAGRPRATIVRLWCLVALCCAGATVVGWAIADNVGGRVLGAVDGFAAGALLVMLVDEMVPEARRRGGAVAGLATVLGFAVAAGLSSTSA